MAEKTCNTCKANKVCDHNKYGFENCNNYISTDVEEVKHGCWEEIKTGEKLYDYCFKCSNCNNETPPNSFVVSPDYCPHCGAKMDGGKAK